MKLLANIFCLILISSIVRGQNTAFIAHGMYQIDHQKKIILINQNVDEVNAQSPSGEYSKISLGNKFELLQTIGNFEYGENYLVESELTSDYYSLYFTRLPIISITTSNTIVDEPRTHAYFYMSEPDQTIVSSNIGIEYRGGWTQTLDKKSLRIEFWEDMEGNATKDVSLLGMRSDDDWNLQAMFNEPLRFHNKTCFELWNRIDTLYYIDEESSAINGVNMSYVEIFINGDYQGVYGLGERIDRKQLKLKKHNGNIRGELYKGDDWTSATLFLDAPAYDNNEVVWSGFEYEHPEEEINWENLHDFVSFVAHSSEQDFMDNYASYIKMDNAVNYFIFINLIRATDNRGKNTYIAKYKANEPYFFVPWDLDGTFGVVWDGNNENITNDILSNHLFDRLLDDCSPNGFVDQVQNRWAFLRQQVITHENITELFLQNHNYLKENGVYKRESLKWETYAYPSDQLNYMSNWLTNRLNFLDTYFTTDCMGLGIADESPLILSVYPNPASTLLNIQTELADDFQISDLLGSTVLRGTIKPGNSQLDISHLNPGVYFLKVQSSGSTVKFVKE